MYLYKLSDKILEWGLFIWCLLWAGYALSLHSLFSVTVNVVLALYWGNLALRHLAYERASSASVRAAYDRVIRQLPQLVDKAMPSRAVLAPNGRDFLLLYWHKPLFRWGSPRYSLVLSRLHSDVMADADNRFTFVSTYYTMPPVRGRVYADDMEKYALVGAPSPLDLLLDRPTGRVEATERDFEELEVALKTWRRRLTV